MTPSGSSAGSSAPISANRRRTAWLTAPLLLLAGCGDGGGEVAQLDPAIRACEILLLDIILAPDTYRRDDAFAYERTAGIDFTMTNVMGVPLAHFAACQFGFIAPPAGDDRFHLIAATLDGIPVDNARIAIAANELVAAGVHAIRDADTQLTPP